MAEEDKVAYPQGPRSIAELATLMRQCLSHATEAWTQALDRLPKDDVLQATAATMYIECGKKGVRPTLAQIENYVETLTSSHEPEPVLSDDEDDGLPF